MKRIILSGVPGCGKSTIISELLKVQKDYELITFGDVMQQFTKDIKRDDLRRNMHKDDYSALQAKTVKEIVKISKQKNIIIDTHLTIHHPFGYTAGVPYSAIQELSPDLIIIVEAKPKDIEKRRAKDTRDRDKESQFQIDLHQQLNRSMAMAVSMLTNCAVKIIYSPQGKVDMAVKELQLAISEL